LLKAKAKHLTFKAKAKDSKFVLEDTSRPRTKAKDNTTDLTTVGVRSIAMLVSVICRSASEHISTTSSATADGPRDALFQSKSCQM